MFVIALIQLSLRGMIVCWLVSPVGTKRRVCLLLH